MRAGIFSLLLVLLVPVAAQAGTQKKIECWRDKNNQRVCGDHVPPEYADQDREILNDRGQVVETVKGAPTAEELAAEARKKKEAEDAKKRAEYDRSLLETYRSVKDLEAMKQERLDFTNGRINAAQKNLDNSVQALEDLRGRAAAQEKEKGKVDERLQKQIREFERAEKRNQRSLRNLTKEREDTEATFDRDIARFRELRGEEPVKDAKKGEAKDPKKDEPAAPKADAAKPAPTPASPPPAKPG